MTAAEYMRIVQLAVDIGVAAVFLYIVCGIIKDIVSGFYKTIDLLFYIILYVAISIVEITEVIFIVHELGVF